MKRILLAAAVIACLASPSFAQDEKKEIKETDKKPAAETEIKRPKQGDPVKNDGNAAGDVKKTPVDQWNVVLHVGKIAGFSIGGGKNGGSMGVNVNPAVSLGANLFLFRGIAFGGTAMYRYMNQKIEIPIIISSMPVKVRVNPKFHVWSAGPSMILYYPLTDNFYPYIKGQFNYGQGFARVKVLMEFSGKGSYMEYGGGLGFIYVFKNNIGLFLEATHIRDRMKMEQPKMISDLIRMNTRGYSTNINLGLSIFL